MSSEEDIKGKSLPSAHSLLRDVDGLEINELDDLNVSKIEKIDSGPLMDSEPSTSTVTELNKEKLEIPKNTTVKKVAIYALGIGMGLGITYVGWKHSDTIISTMGNMMQSASNLVFWGAKKAIESIPEAPQHFANKYPRVIDRSGIETTDWNAYRFNKDQIPDAIEFQESVMTDERNITDFSKLTGFVNEYSLLLFGSLFITGFVPKILRGSKGKVEKDIETQQTSTQVNDSEDEFVEIDEDEFFDIEEHEDVKQLGDIGKENKLLESDTDDLNKSLKEQDELEVGWNSYDSSDSSDNESLGDNQENLKLLRNENQDDKSSIDSSLEGDEYLVNEEDFKNFQKSQRSKTPESQISKTPDLPPNNISKDAKSLLKKVDLLNEKVKKTLEDFELEFKEIESDKKKLQQ